MSDIVDVCTHRDDDGTVCLRPVISSHCEVHDGSVEDSARERHRIICLLEDLACSGSDGWECPSCQALVSVISSGYGHAEGCELAAVLKLLKGGT